MLYTITEAATC